MDQIKTEMKEGAADRFAFSIDPERPLCKGRPAWMWFGGTPGVDVSIAFSKADGELRAEAMEAAKEFMDVLLEIICRYRYLNLQKKLKANLEHIPERTLKTEYMKAYEDITHEIYEISEYVDFSKLPKEETISEVQDAAGECNALSKEKFEEIMQECMKKHHRATFAIDAASDKEQSKGSVQDGELMSALQGIKEVLERMERTLSAATLEPGMAFNLAPTHTQGITKEDIQIHCRLSQEKFDQMIQDYEKRKARTTYAGGMGGGAPGPSISIPCPPKQLGT